MANQEVGRCNLKHVEKLTGVGRYSLRCGIDSIKRRLAQAGTVVADHRK